MLPLVGRYTHDQTVGLKGSLIYDIPDDGSVNQPLVVQGTQFGVACGKIPGNPSAIFDGNRGANLDITWKEISYSSQFQTGMNAPGEQYRALRSQDNESDKHNVLPPTREEFIIDITALQCHIGWRFGARLF